MVAVGLVDEAPEAVCAWFSTTILEVRTDRIGPVEVGVEIEIGVGVEVCVEIEIGVGVEVGAMIEIGVGVEAGTVIEMPTVSQRLSVNAMVSSVSSDESNTFRTETYFANRPDCICFEGLGGVKSPKIDLYRCTRCP